MLPPDLQHATKWLALKGEPIMRRLKTRLCICYGIVTVLLCMAAVSGCHRLSQHPLVVVAVEEVTNNARVIAVIGKPIACSSAITGRPNETDGIAALQFQATGTKGSGLVVVEGKKLGTDWGITLLEFRPADNAERLSLTTDFENHTGIDTPKFDPAATSNAPSQPIALPSDIEITLPTGL